MEDTITIEFEQSSLLKRAINAYREVREIAISAGIVVACGIESLLNLAITIIN